MDPFDMTSYYEAICKDVYPEIKRIHNSWMAEESRLQQELYADFGANYVTHPVMQAIDALTETKHALSELRTMSDPTGLDGPEAILWAELRRYDLIKQLKDMSPEVIIKHKVSLSVTDRPSRKCIDM